jgi:hypothetical protein
MLAALGVPAGTGRPEPVPEAGEPRAGLAGEETNVAAGDPRPNASLPVDMLIACSHQGAGGGDTGLKPRATGGSAAGSGMTGVGAIGSGATGSGAGAVEGAAGLPQELEAVRADDRSLDSIASAGDENEALAGTSLAQTRQDAEGRTVVADALAGAPGLDGAGDAPSRGAARTRDAARRMLASVLADGAASPGEATPATGPSQVPGTTPESAAGGVRATPPGISTVGGDAPVRSEVAAARARFEAAAAGASREETGAAGRAVEASPRGRGQDQPGRGARDRRLMADWPGVGGPAGLPARTPAQALSIEAAASAYVPGMGLTAGTVVLPAVADTPTASEPLSPPHVARQIVRAVSLAWSDEAGEARVRLTPEHLGEVTVNLKVERGVVSAVLQADTETARQWIKAHEDDLRRGLESQGLRLDSLVVTPDGGSQRRQEQPRQPRRRAASPASDAPRFEIDV